MAAEGHVRKVFCIGRNKTGTTSLAAWLEASGFRMGRQAAGELLLDDWAARRFDPIVEFCRSADAFQDIPFSLPFTFQALDRAYPDARFILTVRESAEVWADSLIRFHSQLAGAGRTPTRTDLKAFGYRRPGWIWDVIRLTYGADVEHPYDRARLMAHYTRHNESIMDYFSTRPGRLLRLDLAEPQSGAQLARFLDLDAPARPVPHLNRSTRG